MRRVWAGLRRALAAYRRLVRTRVPYQYEQGHCDFVEGPDEQPGELPEEQLR